MYNTSKHWTKRKTFAWNASILQNLIFGLAGFSEKFMISIAFFFTRDIRV